MVTPCRRYKPRWQPIQKSPERSRWIALTPPRIPAVGPSDTITLPDKRATPSPVASPIQRGYNVPPVPRVGVVRPDPGANVMKSLHSAITQVNETTAVSIPDSAGTVLEHRFDDIPRRATGVLLCGDHPESGPEE